MAAGTGTDPFAGYKTLGGGSTSTSGNGTAPQPTQGGDSLTTFFRSLSNLTGATGAGQFNQGGATIGQGLDTVGKGLDVSQGGVTDQQAAYDALSAPIDYYTKLLSGDPATMTSALAPTASLISQQYEGAKTATGQTLPQGGFRSTALAGLPFAQAGKVGDAALGLQDKAAGSLGTLYGERANIGQGISNTGLGQSGVGLGVAGVGGNQQAQGLQALMSTVSQLLQKMGINLQGSFANQFATIAQGINSLI